MPAIKTATGWKWGSSGKVYPTKREAEEAGRKKLGRGYSKRPKKKY